MCCCHDLKEEVTIFVVKHGSTVEEHAGGPLARQQYDNIKALASEKCKRRCVAPCAHILRVHNLCVVMTTQASNFHMSLLNKALTYCASDKHL